MGVQVFAGVLDVNGAGAQQLRDQGCENLQVLQLDVTDSSQIETTHLHIRAQVGDSGETERCCCHHPLRRRGGVKLNLIQPY